MELIKTNQIQSNLNIYLKVNDIDVGNEVPLGLAALIVAVEADARVVTDGVRKQPGVVVLEPHHRRRHHHIPQLISSR